MKRREQLLNRLTSWSVVVCVLAGRPAFVLAQNPSGVKEQLADRGVSITTLYGGVVSGLDGGHGQGGTYSGNLNVQVSVDGDRLFKRPGLTLFVDGLWIHGGQPSAVLGDAQGVSNLSAPPKATLYEAWLQYNVFGNTFSILAGRYDLNAEFYRVQSAGLFLNSSFGIGPEFSESGAGGPSIFPSTSLGVRLAFKPKPNVVMRGSILDGVPVDRADGSVGAFRGGDGLLIVSEVALMNRGATGDRMGKLRFRIGRASGLPPYDDKVAAGAWYYTATFGDLSHVDASGISAQDHGSAGAYVVGDVTLLRSKTDRRRRLTGFAETGLADARVNRFGSYFGVGSVASGPVSTRPADELGVAVAIARNGSGYLKSRRRYGEPTGRFEAAIELTYLVQIASWLGVQPDFQYVIQPNTDATVPSGRAFQLRFEVAF
jgi:porin